MSKPERSIAVRRRHAQYFRDVFERAPDDWQRMPDADWCARYQPELDNVRAALDWAFGSGGDSAIGIELSAAAGELWYLVFLRNEGQQRLEAAVARIGPQTSESDQARLWRWLGEMWVLKRPAQAVAAFERAVELHRRVGDGSVPGDSARMAWRAVGVHGPRRTGGERSRRSVSRAGTRRGPKDVGSLFSRFRRRKDDDRRLRWLPGSITRRAFALARSAGAERMIVGGLNFLADLAWEIGDLDIALAGFREAAALIRRRAMPGRACLGCASRIWRASTPNGASSTDALAAAREGLPIRKADGTRVARIRSPCSAGGTGGQDSNWRAPRWLLGCRVRGKSHTAPSQRGRARAIGCRRCCGKGLIPTNSSACLPKARS